MFHFDILSFISYILSLNLIEWKISKNEKPNKLFCFPRSKLIRVENFEAYFKKQQADSNCGFAEEYEAGGHKLFCIVVNLWVRGSLEGREDYACFSGAPCCWLGSSHRTFIFGGICVYLVATWRLPRERQKWGIEARGPLTRVIKPHEWWKSQMGHSEVWGLTAMGAKLTWVRCFFTHLCLPDSPTFYPPDWPRNCPYSEVHARFLLTRCSLVQSLLLYS